MVKTTKLLDFGDYPHIYCDGIGDVHYIGANATMYPFVWRRIEGIFQPVISAVVVRPIATMTPHIDEMIERALALPPVMDAQSAMMLHAH